MSEVERNFREPISFPVKEDIENPDGVIDEIIEAYKDDPEAAQEFASLKGLEHDEKVQYLLSLPDADRELGCLSYVFIIVTYACVMVIVGTWPDGKPKKKKKCKTKKVKKCVKKK